jgi:HPt (histidine-containing phosphotransfer) domain-containing protein
MDPTDLIDADVVATLVELPEIWPSALDECGLSVTDGLAAIEHGLAASDLGTVRTRAHALKGATATVGAKAVSAAFKRAEIAAKANDLPGIRDALRGVADLWQASTAALRSYTPT